MKTYWAVLSSATILASELTIILWLTGILLVSLIVSIEAKKISGICFDKVTSDGMLALKMFRSNIFF